MCFGAKSYTYGSLTKTLSLGSRTLSILNLKQVKNSVSQTKISMHFILHSEFICQKAALLKNKNKKTHINCFFLSLVLTINIGCQDIFNNFINMLTLSNLVPLHTDYCTSFTAFPTFWCQAISTGFKSHPYLRGCSNRKVRRGLNALDFGLALSSKAISKILLIVILCIGFLKYLASTFLFFL